MCLFLLQSLPVREATGRDCGYGWPEEAAFELRGILGVFSARRAAVLCIARNWEQGQRFRRVCREGYDTLVNSVSLVYGEWERTWRDLE